MFTQTSLKWTSVIIYLYVDDMLIVGTNIVIINNTKLFLSLCFEITDLGEVDMILDVKIRKTENGFCLCQSHHIENLLRDLAILMLHL